MLYSIRKVCHTNKGALTPGIDGTIYGTASGRMGLYKEIRSMDFDEYQAIPVKRIYIPKPDGRMRPIGIPSLKDRVIQQMVKNTLEPECESYFEGSSYGFRPARSVNDAINRIYVTLGKENSRVWVVEADLVGCFDNISHASMLNGVKHHPQKHLIQEWLTAGIVYESVFFDTDQGSPQGSVISPLLCNIALHGLESDLGIKIDPKGHVKSGGRSLVRFADDFVVLCYTLEDAKRVLASLPGILAKRGLQLNDSKTRITHACEGFDFLGFNIKISPMDGRSEADVINKVGDDFVYNYRETLLVIKPSNKSIQKFKNTLKDCFVKKAGSNAVALISNANPIIRGWAQSKYAWHCTRTFHDLDHYIYGLCWRWMHRAHPKMSSSWLKSKYFRHKTEFGFNNKWVFSAKFIPKRNKGVVRDLDLLQLKWFKPSRHVMIRNLANPDDP